MYINTTPAASLASKINNNCLSYNVPITLLSVNGLQNIELGCDILYIILWDCGII